ncbi:MAG: hypothetical protein V2A74_01485 [bacterium]
MRRSNILSPTKAGPVLGLVLVGLAFCFAVAAHAQGGDALYLRDGSVLRGDIVRDTLGDYLVFNKYGSLSISAKDVLYRVDGDEGETLANETYIIIDKSRDVIAVLQRDVPKREKDGESFNLLVPGSVEAVTDGFESEIAYQTKSVAGLTRVTIRYSDVPPEVAHVFVTTRQKNLLEEDKEGNLKFRQDYVLDTEGTLKVLVKYPESWKVGEVAPEPSRRYEGLLVWEARLKRQQGFAAETVFEFQKASSE